MTEQKPEYETDELIYTRRQLAFAFNAFNRFAAARGQGAGITAYGGDRDYDVVLGYAPSIDAATYRLRFTRQDIANRVVSLPCEDTWKNPPKISENDNENTPFVKAWQALATQLKVWNVLKRADVLSGIGYYGVIMIGVKGSDEVLSNPVEKDGGKGGITYLRPYSQENINITQWESDPKNPRYGMPRIYQITVTSGIDGDFTGGTSSTLSVHYTRIIHLAEGRLDSETFGTPRLEPVFNQLDNDMKVVGGGAEATWLNMRPGIAVGPKEGYDIDESDTGKQAFLDEIERYLHDQARVMRAGGMDVTPIGTGQVMEIADISDVIISRISATTGIPQGKLKGSAAGELASAQEDEKRWASTVSSRQTTYAEPEILRVFIDWMIWAGVLPAPADGYDVGTLVPGKQIRKWPSIIEQTEEEQNETRLKWAQAAKTLEDTNTGRMPPTEAEKREALGLPEAELPDDVNIEALLGTLALSANKLEQGKQTAAEHLAMVTAAFADLMEARRLDNLG